MRKDSSDKPGLHWRLVGEKRWKAKRTGRTYVIEQQTNGLFLAFDPGWPARAFDPMTTFQEALMAAQQLADEWDEQQEESENV